MKADIFKLYSRDFWIFPPNTIKIDRYNFELYRFKAGPFFETQCSSPSGLRPKLKYLVIRNIKTEIRTCRATWACVQGCPVVACPSVQRSYTCWQVPVSARLETENVVRSPRRRHCPVCAPELPWTALGSPGCRRGSRPICRDPRQSPTETLVSTNWSSVLSALEAGVLSTNVTVVICVNVQKMVKWLPIL